MRQTGRSHIKSSSEWLLVLLLLSPSFTTTQYASSLYNSQFYDHNQQQVQQQLQQQQPSVYPDIPVTYNQQYPAAVQSIWSTAPIVVNDGDNSLEQDRRYLPINYYNNRETYPNIESERSNNNNNNYNYNNVPTTRAANHNYNNIPGYYYYTQPPLQPQPQSQQEVEQRELLAVADSQREEEQIVRIGGSRSLAPNTYSNNNNYLESPQPLPRRDYEAKYAKHYSDYLRKYPQRLQPIYNTGTPYVDK